MPRRNQSLPRYRKHKASGRAIVTLSGEDFYLGPYGSKASKLEYNASSPSGFSVAAHR